MHKSEGLTPNETDATLTPSSAKSAKEANPKCTGAADQKCMGAAQSEKGANPKCTGAADSKCRLTLN